MSKVLVTGGAGFIGSALVKKLVTQGRKVLVVDNLSSGDAKKLPPGVAFHNTDITSLAVEDWAALIGETDSVFHLAAKKLNSPGVTDRELVATNISASMALCRAAAMKKARRIVFTSSLYVYGHSSSVSTSESLTPSPQTLYGVSKLAGEGIMDALLSGSSVSWAVARLYFCYGPGQFPGSGYKSVIVKNFERIRDSLQPQICGSGTQSLDYVYVDDVVQALLALEASTLTGEVFNVSSGDVVSVNELTSLMAEVARVPGIQTERIEADWTEGTRRGGSYEKIKESLGWAPKTSLTDGLRATWHSVLDSKGFPR